MKTLTLLALLALTACNPLKGFLDTPSKPKPPVGIGPHATPIKWEVGPHDPPTARTPKPVPTPLHTPNPAATAGEFTPAPLHTPNPAATAIDP